MVSADSEVGMRLVTQLLQSQQNAVSEYELFNLAYGLTRKHKLDMRLFLNHINMSALNTSEKHAISATLDLSAAEFPEMWNSLVRSDILTSRDLYQRSLGTPFSIQRLYSSHAHGLASFFEYLRMGTQDYTRKLVILQVRDQFSTILIVADII